MEKNKINNDNFSEMENEVYLEGMYNDVLGFGYIDKNRSSKKVEEIIIEDEKEIIYCKMCGSKIDKKWRFCNRCGRLLNNEVEIINNFDNVSSSHNNKERIEIQTTILKIFIIIVICILVLTLSLILIDI